MYLDYKIKNKTYNGKTTEIILKVYQGDFIDAIETDDNFNEIIVNRYRRIKTDGVINISVVGEISDTDLPYSLDEELKIYRDEYLPDLLLLEEQSNVSI